MSVLPVWRVPYFLYGIAETLEDRRRESFSSSMVSYLIDNQQYGRDGGYSKHCSG